VENYTKLSNRLKKASYPDNHHYDVKTLEPIGVMKDRWDIIEKAPEFKAGGKFLDVGSNKGFISLKLAIYYEKIVGYEPLKDLVSLSSDIAAAHKIKNIEFLEGYYEDIPDDEVYDVVYLGNCHHYIFRNCVTNGEKFYEWTEKLKKICSKYLIIDGVHSGNDFAMRGMGRDEGWPEGVLKEYSLFNLSESLESDFMLIKFIKNGIGYYNVKNNSGRHIAIYERNTP